MNKPTKTVKLLDFVLPEAVKELQDFLEDNLELGREEAILACVEAINNICGTFSLRDSQILKDEVVDLIEGYDE